MTKYTHSTAGFYLRTESYCYIFETVLTKIYDYLPNDLQWSRSIFFQNQKNRGPKKVENHWWVHTVSLLFRFFVLLLCAQNYVCKPCNDRTTRVNKNVTVSVIIKLVLAVPRLPSSFRRGGGGVYCVGVLRIVILCK